MNQTTSNENTLKDEAVDEIPIETLYCRSPTILWHTSCSQAVTGAGDSAGDLLLSGIGPTDLEATYEKITRLLMTTRKVEPRMITMCSHSVRTFYNAAQEICRGIEGMLSNIVSAIQNLITVPHTDFPREALNIAWFQIICKSIRVWNFHALPKHLQAHFHSVNNNASVWIQKLEESTQKLTRSIKEFKTEFREYYSYLEANHTLGTWVQKKFKFNSEDYLEKASCDHLASFPHSHSSRSSKLSLNFRDYDMELVDTNPRGSKTTLLSLNKSSSTVQIGLITLIFAQLNTIVSNAMVNLNQALAVRKKYLTTKQLHRALPQYNRKRLKTDAYQFENLVIALGIEAIFKGIDKTILNVGVLKDAVTIFSHMYEMVQLNLENRGIAEASTVSPSAKRNRPKMVLELNSEHFKNDYYLQDTLHLLRSAVDAMPNSYTILDSSLKQTYLHWAKLAKKDSQLVEKISQISEPDEEVEGKPEEMPQVELSAINIAADTFKGPIDFEEAMMQTTTGKAFFPDISHFSPNIELWRAFCFRMLATALDKFGEMATSKIVDTKVTLTQPHVSQTLLQSSTSSLKIESAKVKIQPQLAKAHVVGYTEGICSILCFITRNLTKRDRVFVSHQDLKLLNEKFHAITKVVEKFKKDLDLVEKVLINSLSLAMASIEYKWLPQDLPVSPDDEDFLISHDFEDVSSQTSDKPDNSTKPDLKDSNNNIRLCWNSSDKQKLMCYNSKPDSSPFDFSKLRISTQLYIVHSLIDELIEEFSKARESLLESKADICCAKKLLEKTWKGIGKDKKKQRLPSSGVLVLVKLYRHQIATAVVNAKTVKRTAREVHFLLAQSTRNVKVWVAEGDHHIGKRGGILMDKNYVMSLDNLAIMIFLKTHLPPENWLELDPNKGGLAGGMQLEATEKITLTVGDENVLEIKPAVKIKSSTFFDVSKDMMKQFSDYISSKSQNFPGKQPLASKSLSTKEEDFVEAASIIEKLILLELKQSVAILKLPNCSTSGVPTDNVPNMIGIMFALADTTVSIRSCKDITIPQRDSVMNSLKRVETQINGICDQRKTANLLNGIDKIRKRAVQLDAYIRNKFRTDKRDNYPTVSANKVEQAELLDGITPMEFVEGVAAASSAHVWTLMSGIAGIGVVIKDNKTMESHALANLPSSSKLEVLFSLLHFILKFVDHVQSDFDITRNNVLRAKKMMKQQFKTLEATSKAKGSDVFIEGWKIVEYLKASEQIIIACKSAEDIVAQIGETLLCAKEVLSRVMLYFNLKFRNEFPSGVQPELINDMILRSKNWYSVDTMAGLKNPPRVPPPQILKKSVSRQVKQDAEQSKYKTAVKNKTLELEFFFCELCTREIAVDIPIKLFPMNGLVEEKGGDGSDE